MWLDLNGNGIQETCGPSIGGAIVNLVNPQGQVISTTAKDSSGIYSFSNKGESIHQRDKAGWHRHCYLAAAVAAGRPRNVAGRSGQQRRRGLGRSDKPRCRPFARTGAATRDRLWLRASRDRRPCVCGEMPTATADDDTVNSDSAHYECSNRSTMKHQQRSSAEHDRDHFQSVTLRRTETSSAVCCR